MKIISIIALVAGAPLPAMAQMYDPQGMFGSGANPKSHQVDGYYNSRGTYVEPYRRTNPNDTTTDNYNARRNDNIFGDIYGRR